MTDGLERKRVSVFVRPTVGDALQGSLGWWGFIVAAVRAVRLTRRRG